MAIEPERTTVRLLGESPAMRQVRRQVRTFGALDEPVLIEGESGTGKRLVARAIHQASPRCEGPFRVASAIGLEGHLLLSHLFGHRRGVFPGAGSDEPGLFEAARGGTLLFEQLGDLPAEAQEQLLRTLVTGEIVRLGDATPRPIDARFLAAISGSPAGNVTAGRLHRDLLDRLRAARVVLPPLRSRVEDIPLLAMEFLERIAAAYDKRIDGISRDALDRLIRHHWPGNVRELEAAIECAVIWATGPTVRAGDLPPELSR